MNARTRIIALLSLVAAAANMVSPALADPLPGRDLLKFSQRPMDATPVGGALYWGHDEISTAYAPVSTVVPAPPTIYRGDFMADDFADTFSTPVVHVKWWGSYLNHTNVSGGHIQKFMIAFEQDVPTPNLLGFSYPDPNGPIFSQIVTLGALSPQSGTFTEKFVSPGGPPLGEELYEYNAELKLPFAQQKDTVHWLKIVALVDQVPGTPAPIWGWHNRDYTQQNLSASPNVAPGENLQGNAASGPVWHFQDDAVSGKVDIGTFINTAGVQQIAAVQQNLTSYNDENYINNLDGPPGIGAFSKDLAFELYTVQIPEPASCLLMAVGLAGSLFARRRMRNS